MKKSLPIIALAIAAFLAWGEYAPETADTRSQSSSPQQNNSALEDAIAAQRSDVQVQGTGKVVKVLPDDNKGSRHQRFILKLSSGNTILIAHNIDLAPKIQTLRNGDTVSFYGEFEWNSRGGVVHWTHADPGGRHVGGWLKHQGKTYQ